MNYPAALKTVGPLLFLRRKLPAHVFDGYPAFVFHHVEPVAEFSDIAYDFVGPEGQRSDAKKRALQIWDRMRRQATIPSAPQIPLSANGTIQREVVDRLLSKRDNRPVEIYE